MESTAPDNEVRFALIQERTLRGCQLREGSITGRFASPSHPHEHAWVTLVLGGLCEETYRGTTRRFPPLTASFHHPGESHAVRTFEQGVRTFGVEFDPVWMEQLPEHGASLSTVDALQSKPLTWLTMRLYREFKQTDDASALAIEGLLLEVLAALARTAAPSAKEAPPWLRHVEAYVQEHYDRSVSLSTLAAVVGVHPSHLARVFRAHYDCTLGAYLRRVRIERARRQIIEGSAPLAEIALRVGFADQSHFSRIFKRHTGMTPSEFRRLFA